jgi:transcriptional regulator with XRE-family HTH domain
MGVNPSFGTFLKQIRLNNDLTLRQFCLEHDLDPSLISRIERGILPPPADETEKINLALALGIQEGSDLWVEFLTLAADCQEPLKDDDYEEERLLKEFPCLFQTDIGPDLSEFELHHLMDRIGKELHIAIESS